MSKLILEENESKNYKPRTEVNAKSAELTIAIALKHDTAGERVTKEFVAKHNKKYIAVRPEGNIKEKAEKIVDKINEFNLPQYICLNVAGNGLYTISGEMNQQQADDFTYQLLKSITENPKLKSKIALVRSGGQTGFDEAGAKAGLKLGLSTIVHMPKGFLIRTQDGRDVTMSAEHAKHRFDIGEPIVEKKVKIFCDMDGVLCDFKGAYLQWKGTHPEITYPQSQYGFFSNLEPMPGAVEAFKKLEEHFEMYILTRPSTYNLNCYTEKADWVRRHLGFHVLENFITMCNKSLVQGKGAYLIDDDIQAGQLEFEGELIQFGKEKCPDWDAVLKYLIK